MGEGDGSLWNQGEVIVLIEAFEVQKARVLQVSHEVLFTIITVF